MRKNFFFLVLLLGGFVSVHSQIEDGWTEAGNASYNSTLHSIVFTSELNGFAGGTGGAFLKTTDGGLSWTAFDTGHEVKITGVFFTDALTGYIVGNVQEDWQGRMLKTTDGGQTWEQIYAASHSIHNLFFENAEVGYLVGYNRFLKTTDGGQTWFVHNFSNAYDAYDVYFKNASEGFIAANGGAFQTMDGGQTWTQFLDGTFYRIQFTDADHGFMTSNSHSHLFKTTNGGADWVPTSQTGIGNCNSLFFKDSQNGFAWSQNQYAVRKLMKTTNGGDSWTEVIVPSNLIMYDMCQRPDGQFFLCGAGGTIAKSANGNNWSIASEGLFRGMLLDMCFAPDATIYACGDNGTIVMSTDNASSWTRLPSGTTEKLWGISVTPSGTLFVFGDNKTVLKSVDGGMNWTPSNNGFTTSNANQGEIRFVDDQTGFIAFANVFKTTDGGANWIKVLDTLNSVSIDPINDTLIYASGFDGVFKTTDGGITWGNINKQSKIFWGFDFLDAENGVAAYQDYYVYHTSDGGGNWTRYKFEGKELRDAAMLDHNTLYVVGKNGLIGKSSDGAVSWEVVNSHTIRSLFDVFFGPDGTGYILGADGMVLRKPFVPTFTLRFEIEDLSGNAVENAVVTLNQFTYPAGTYSFSGLIAGEYEYKISGAGFCDRQGMINLMEDYTENIVLENCYNLTFIVSNIYDTPVEGAEVQLGESLSITNSSGVAKINHKAGLNVDYRISASRFLPVAGQTDITRDSTYVFRLQTDLQPPVAQAATDLSVEGFRAHWDMAENAQYASLYVSSDDFQTHLEGFEGVEVYDEEYLVSGLQAGTDYAYRLKSVNGDGESGFSNVIAVTTLTVGFSDEVKAAEFAIIPNPAGQTIRLQSSMEREVRLEILDIHGKCLVNETTIRTGTWAGDISHFLPGLYLMRIKTEKDSVVLKFIKN